MSSYQETKTEWKYKTEDASMGLGLADFSTDSLTFCHLARELPANPPDAFALMEDGQALSLNVCTVCARQLPANPPDAFALMEDGRALSLNVCTVCGNKFNFHLFYGSTN